MLSRWITLSQCARPLQSVSLSVLGRAAQAAGHIGYTEVDREAGGMEVLWVGLCSSAAVQLGGGGRL